MRGSRPGERRGGRKPGIPNRSTTERLEIARLAEAAATASGRKLGKEVLEELMVLFKDIALELQPESREAERFAAWLKSSKEAQFHKYASLAVKAEDASTKRPRNQLTSGDGTKRTC
jgi:hypothetical protein